MKAIETHLYQRNGFLYYRSVLPKIIRPVLKRKEVVISLGEVSRVDARLLVAKIDFQITQLLQAKQRPVSCDVWLEGLKLGLGLKPTLAYALTGDSAITLEEASQRYLKDCVSDAPKTRSHKDRTIRQFMEFSGLTSFDSITKAEARSYKEFLQQLPKHYHQKTKGGAALNNGNSELQHPRTINSKLKVLASLCRWGLSNGFLEGENPFNGLFLRESAANSLKRLPFENSELRTMFGENVDSSILGSSGLWVPLIGAYAGLRLNEICQLKPEDCKRLGSSWVFEINDRDEKRIKTVSSQRVVPIHPELLKRGILEVASKAPANSRIFSDIRLGVDGTYSSVFSKKFNRFLKASNLKRRGLCFHSLRHNFVDALRNKGVDPLIIMALSGHSTKKSVHSGYGLGYSVDLLTDRIKVIEY